MTSLKLVSCVFLASASLAACSDGAPSAEDIDASLKAATASALPDADAGSIEVLNPQRSAAAWRWNAKAGGKVYACDADNQMRLPSCQAMS